MAWSKGTFNFDILALPGIACLSLGVGFRAKLLSYTLVPLALMFCLRLPCVVAYFLCHLHPMDPVYQEKWNGTVNRFWNNTIFVLFIIYPFHHLGHIFGCVQLPTKRLGLVDSRLQRTVP
jgi:hypothetical protein